MINLHKSFRALILFGVALQLFLAQTLEVLRTAIAHKKGSRHNIIDAIVFIPQGAVQRKSLQLAFLISDQTHSFFKRIDRLNITANRFLHSF